MYFEFLFVAFAVLQEGAAFERLFHSQLEHIEIAGMLGLGVFDDAKIELKRFNLS